MLGPGGVGGLLGGLLIRGGHRVEFLAGEDTIEALRVGGLSVSSVRFGDFSVPARAAPCLSGPVNVCLITTKATTLDVALTRVPHSVLGDGLVVPLLNGVEHMTRLRERYPPGQVAAGVIRVESARVAPGRIEHTSPSVSVELASSTAPRYRLEALAARLRDVGIRTVVRDDESSMLWDKLSFLAPLALLTTRHAAPVGVVRRAHRPELSAVIAEVTAVARSIGAAADAQAILHIFDSAPAGMKSSMQRDAEANRPTELDAIGGAVLRAAGRFGVQVPNTEKLVTELRELERRRCGGG